MAKIPINIQEGKIDSTEEVIVGIDLGTTNSLIAYINEGEAKVIKDQSGKHSLVPSIIHFGPENKVIVGHEARKMAIKEPKQTIYSVKRLMGKSFSDIEKVHEFFAYDIIEEEDEEKLVKIRVGERFFSPIELSAYILKNLKERAEHELQLPIQKCVITVPAYFNDSQRQATRDAGKLAGLDVLRIINEPTAASLAYGLGQHQKEQTIAVYDLGGGTFDITLLKIHEGIFEVLATHGNTFLGGDDFDQAIIQHWLENTPLDSSQFKSDKSLKQTIRLKAEEAKKVLSTKEQFEGEIEGVALSLERPTFHKLIEPYVEKTLAACRKALDDAELNPGDINTVVMVGGSTRVPYVKKKVEDLFQVKPFDELNPDEVVALGAAIQADILAGKQKDILLLDVTPLSLGIETLGGLMDVIVPRNTTIPTRAGRQYTTSVDGQKNLKISVFQGERDLVEHNRKLGEFILTDIPPMPAGIPKIEVHFILDADGILQVRAKELRSGRQQEIQIKPQYGITEEEMAKMLLDSIQHAEEDMKTRALLEARNEARNMIQATEKFINQHEDHLSEQQKEKLAFFSDKLSKAMKGEDKDLIEKQIQALNDYSKPIAEEMMDLTISDAMKGKQLE